MYSGTYNHEEIISEIRAFLDIPATLSINENLFDLHIMDSLEAENLRLYLESEYDIEVYMEDMTMENFRSLHSIAHFTLSNKLRTVDNNLTLHDVISMRSELSSETTFIESLPDNISLSFKQFDKLTMRSVDLLYKLGVRQGDCVGISMQNRVLPVLLYFGCLRLGAIAVPLDFGLSEAEVIRIVNHSQLKVLMVYEHHFEKLQSRSAEIPNVKHLINLDMKDIPTPLDFFQIFSSIDESTTERDAKMANNPENPGIILYTSGTTGDPKGVVLTHRNLLTNANSISEAMGLNENSRLLNILSLHHTNGQVINLLAPFMAGSMVVLDEVFGVFSVSSLWEKVENYQITMIDLVPTILVLLLRYKSRRECDLHTLKYILCGAAPLPVEVQTRFEKRYNCKIIQEYGLTETTCVTSMDNVANRRIGSIGKPLSCNDMIVVDDEGKEIDDNTIGEIIVRGKNIMSGYYHDQAKTESMIKNGWLYTGDLGFKDSDGYFFVNGRKKDIILKGGVTIYPSDIDNVLSRHPAISECATIAIHDDLYGEEIKSYVVLNPGHEVIETNSLLEFCQSQLSLYSCPKIIEVISSLPKTSSGKIKKGELASMSKGADD